jgi:hypothetical protein
MPPRVETSAEFDQFSCARAVLAAATRDLFVFRSALRTKSENPFPAQRKKIALTLQNKFDYFATRIVRFE